MPCEVRTRLEEKYYRAAAAFNAAQALLHEKIATATPEEYEELKRACFEAFEAQAAARAALDQHTAARAAAAARFR